MELTMQTVNMLEAKSSLSRLVESIELGEEREIVIARNGRPVAKLVPIGVTSEKRIGIAKGLFEVPDDIDGHNDEVARMFVGEARS
jgi:antitoxin (DNA-binding transcriptional repressor) of toxin-antitoxin stability system